MPKSDLRVYLIAAAGLAAPPLSSGSIQNGVISALRLLPPAGGRCCCGRARVDGEVAVDATRLLRSLRCLSLLDPRGGTSGFSAREWRYLWTTTRWSRWTAGEVRGHGN